MEPKEIVLYNHTLMLAKKNELLRQVEGDKRLLNDLSGTTPEEFAIMLSHDRGPTREEIYAFASESIHLTPTQKRTIGIDPSTQAKGRDVFSYLKRLTEQMDETDSITDYVRGDLYKKINHPIYRVFQMNLKEFMQYIT